MNHHLQITIACIGIAFFLGWAENKYKEREAFWQDRWSIIQYDQGVPCL